MTKVHFTSALNRFFPKLASIEVEATKVSDVLTEIEKHFPGIKSFIVDDTGNIRSHVNIFVGEEIASLDHELKNKDEVFIFQALSGG